MTSEIPKESGQKKRRITMRNGRGEYQLYAEAVWIGADLLVYIWGGDRPHIGAVAAAQPRPSLKDPTVTSATASVLAYVGHKEDMLAKTGAEALSAALETRVVVTAGLHWDHIDEAGIKEVMALSQDLIRKLISKLKG